MVPDQAYTVEAFFPNFDQLRKVASVKAVSATSASSTPDKVTSGGAATPEPKKHKK
jgi:hypothetical protein